MERANPVLGFKLRFLNDNGNQIIRKVEVGTINFQDVMRHLRRGESVLITPKLLSNQSTNMKRQENQAPWYFTHT